MKEEPLDEQYFKWLYRQVADPDATDPSVTYWRLLKQLYTTEFVWLVHNDRNRLEDGKELRNDFIREEGLADVDPSWVEIGCSMLELAVGLARHLAFMAEGTTAYWFWDLMENLGIRKYHDNVKYPVRRVDDVLETVIQRGYDSDGNGGFFPLKHATRNQRGEELWEQLNSYVMEQYDA